MIEIPVEYKNFSLNIVITRFYHQPFEPKISDYPGCEEYVEPTDGYIEILDDYIEYPLTDDELDFLKRFIDDPYEVFLEVINIFCDEVNREILNYLHYSE